MDRRKMFRPDRLRKLLDAIDVPASDVAETMSISYPSLNNYLAGRAIPGLPALMEMAEYFGVSLDYLTGRMSDEEAQSGEDGIKQHYMLLYRDSYEGFVRAGKYYPHIGGKHMSPWPYNLVDEVLAYDFSSGIPFVLTEEQETGLDMALNTLPERTRALLLKYYRDGVDHEKCAREYGVTRERIRQIITKGVRTLRHPSRVNLILYGPDAAAEMNVIKEHKRDVETAKSEIEALSNEINRLREDVISTTNDSQLQIGDIASVTDAMELEDLDFSVRTYNCLHRARLSNCSKIMAAARSGELPKIRNLGRKSLLEIVTKMQTLGYEISVDEVYGVGNGVL